VTLLELRGISVSFVGRQNWSRRGRLVKACDDVWLDIEEGETVGLVGESGSGKSTLGRVAVLLQAPDGGELVFDGASLSKASRKTVRSWRPQLQCIFQDPRSSLNPRWRVGQSILRPLRIHGLGVWADESAALEELFGEVELDPDLASSFPHELSGGQAQRVCIARALALRPRFIVADEALSGLDISTQVQILDLLERLQRGHRVAFLFISHDLRVVRKISSRVAVMHHGRIVEFRHTQELFEKPADRYTQTLLRDVVHALPT
jgi:ABC-type glutathione transport system ATPase component